MSPKECPQASRLRIYLSIRLLSLLRYRRIWHRLQGRRDSVRLLSLIQRLMLRLLIWWGNQLNWWALKLQCKFVILKWSRNYHKVSLSFYVDGVLVMMDIGIDKKGYQWSQLKIYSVFNELFLFYRMRNNQKEISIKELVILFIFYFEFDAFISFAY